MHKFFLLALGSLLLTATICLADDQATQVATQQTKQLLLDPNAMDKAAAGDPMAQAALNAKKNLTSDPEKQKQIDAVSADIFEDLVAKTGGDPEKIMEMLQQAQANPSAFQQSLTPEQQKKLSSLAQSIDGERKPSSVSTPANLTSVSGSH